MDLSTGKRRRYDIASLIGDCQSKDATEDIASFSNPRQEHNIHHNTGKMVI